MPTTTETATTTSTSVRKLPKPLRKANVVYKILMACLSGVSVCLTAFSDIDPLYYQIVSILGTAFPVVWTQVLDECKQYVEQSTPTPGSPASPATDVTIDIPVDSSV